MKSLVSRICLYQENHWYQDYSQPDFNPTLEQANLGHPIQGEDEIKEFKNTNNEFLSIKAFLLNKRLLSIGTGYGAYEEPIATHLASMTCVEPDQKSTDYLSQLFSNNPTASIRQQTMDEFMASSTDIFDVILTVNPSHFSQNPFHFTKCWFLLIQRHLHQKGTFILQKHYGACYKNGLPRSKYTLKHWISTARQHNLNLTVIASTHREGHCYLIFTKEPCDEALLDLTKHTTYPMDVYVKNNTLITYNRYSIINRLIHVFVLGAYIPYSIIKKRHWLRELKVNLALIFKS